jgi:hypothetical protein
VQNSNLRLDPGGLSGSNYALGVYQHEAGDVTGIWIKYSNPTIQVVNYTLDEGSDWYVVNPGDAFTPANIQAGAFTKLMEVTGVPPYDPLYPAANVGPNDFWLGVATGKTLFGPRTVFGWVHLRPQFPSSNTLTMVENAVSYNSPGIIVNTTTLVPEPGTVALLIAASAFLTGAIRRR